MMVYSPHSLCVLPPLLPIKGNERGAGKASWRGVLIYKERGPLWNVLVSYCSRNKLPQI